MSNSTPPTNKSDLLKWKLQGNKLSAMGRSLGVLYEDWFIENWSWLMQENMISNIRTGWAPERILFDVLGDSVIVLPARNPQLFWIAKGHLNDS